jgi:EAL domain-containing protein (putative c-di-GMP-specific phosphodiesterase class I)/GGDEF domain-containing protein
VGFCLPIRTIVSRISPSWGPFTRSGDRALVTVAVAAIAGLIVVIQMAAVGVLPGHLSAGLAVGCVSAFAGVGFLTASAAANRSGGLEARFWRLMSYGLLSWTLGCLPYYAYLATGGDLSRPAAWSQIGFLLAYPFWYRGLWMLRQPGLEDSRWGRVEALAIEASIFGLLGVVVVAALWSSSLPAAENIAQLVPVTLDLFLLAALYNAIRRSPVTHRAAFVWFAYAFAGLAVTDALVTYQVTRGPSLVAVGYTMIGYMAAMALIPVAARRPLRVTEAQATLGLSKTILAAVGLALTGPASALSPASFRPVIWAVGAFLFWRLCALLRAHGESDTDILTGFLEARAFSRHVAGVVQAASSANPAIVVAVDLDGFGRWNAQNGYAAGDSLLGAVAARLEASALTGGFWSRLGADRFAWIGIGHDASTARHLADLACGVAADNLGELGARATFVVLPDDATTAVNAMAAVDEGLAAAKAGRRRVVAFDRGRLDGVDYSAGYTASLAQRRAAIVEILNDPTTIATVFQPIVSLDNGRTVGFEALSRFRAEPERSPDKWIAEAHAVGLGLEVEVECVRRACRHRAALPDGAYLSINMSPDAVLFPEMEDAVGDDTLEGLVIEITEHEAVRDYARLASRLADFRGRGARVAIDDTGAGHASMRHVTQLAPDYIKVDRSLIQDLHLDHAKRALVRSMVTLEKELGAEVVAEGIESTEELRALRELGVPLGQGFLLARPRSEPTPAAWSVESLEQSGSFGHAPV